MRKRITAILLAGFCLSATACSSPSIAALEADQKAQDELPQSLSAEALGVDPDSVRFAASEEGIDFYLARQDTPDGGVCVVINVVDEPERAMSACGGTEPSVQPLTAELLGYAKAHVVTDDFQASDLVDEGLEQIHPNIWAKVL